MKNTYSFTFFAAVILGFSLISIHGCKKDDKNLPETVSDIDGNVYHTVSIGTQVWMVENLKTITLNDGTSIPRVENNSTWPTFNLPAYCWYNNDAANKNTYGALYNWYTVNTVKLAPVGWHVPSDADWMTLFTFLGGGNSVSGSKLKETGTTHWLGPTNPITLATNESGFSALPGGFRAFNLNGNYFSLGERGLWWSSIKSSAASARSLSLSYNSEFLNFEANSFNYGFSVRCLKD